MPHVFPRVKTEGRRIRNRADTKSGREISDLGMEGGGRGEGGEREGDEMGSVAVVDG